MEIRSPSVYGSNESFSESPFRFWRLHLSAPSININWSLQTYKKTAIFSPPTQRSGYVPWGHHWHEFLKRKLVLEIDSFPMLNHNRTFRKLLVSTSWMALTFLWRPGRRPNNRPHWLASTFLPPWTVAAVTVCVWESCFLSRTDKHTLHCWFWPHLCWLKSHLISQHTHSMSCGNWRRCVFSLFFATTQLCKHRRSHRLSSRGDVSSRRRLRTCIRIKHVPAPIKERDCLSSAKKKMR